MSAPADPPLAARWRALAALIARHRDVLDARSVAGEVPAAHAARGWDGPLLALDDATLVRLEIEGADASLPASLPASLRALAEEVRALVALPPLAPDGGHAAPALRRLRRLEKPRKREQVEALAGLIAPRLAGARRVLEVGAGHGHLAREVAARCDAEVIGLERDLARTRRASALDTAGRLSFETRDVLDRGLSLAEGDLALGLHACGELGDALVCAAREASAAVLLVGCCLQKLRAPARAPLCPPADLAPDTAAALVLPKGLLGLTNFTPREQGVEASRAENVAARERRHALFALLEEALGPLRLGVELEGQNRRAAHGDFDRMVERAFDLRGLLPPTAPERARALALGRARHDRIRRLELPRAWLGRAIEVWVAVDRARHLEQGGHASRVGLVFDRAVSARNVGVWAWPALPRPGATL